MPESARAGNARPQAIVVRVVILISFELTALGFAIAWPMDSTQAFHAIVNILLIPLWLLSGALFPLSGAAGWMRFCMMLNPLTYGVEALRGALFPDAPTQFQLAVNLGVTAVPELAFRDGIMDRIRLREPRFDERAYLYKNLEKQVKLRHIVVDAPKDLPQDQAEAARTKLNNALTKIKGGAAFATVAKDVSSDDRTKGRGGEMGWRKKGFWPVLPEGEHLDPTSGLLY